MMSICLFSIFDAALYPSKELDETLASDREREFWIFPTCSNFSHAVVAKIVGFIRGNIQAQLFTNNFIPQSLMLLRKTSQHLICKQFFGCHGDEKKFFG